LGPGNVERAEVPSGQEAAGGDSARLEARSEPLEKRAKVIAGEVTRSVSRWQVEATLRR
jgi:hypothetical protein